MSFHLQQGPADDSEVIQGQQIATSVNFVANSHAMATVRAELFRLAAFPSIPVLILGETGAGKEAVSRELHRLTFKQQDSMEGRFVHVNLSNLPTELIESELFGHRSGAFTGAVHSRKGLFAAADKGSLLLDEIGDLAPNLQSKLLNFLDSGKIRPLGMNQVIQVDTRVMAATNADLNKLVRANKFRQDLYYRLTAAVINVPPLRERVEDIPELVRAFLTGSRIWFQGGEKYTCQEAAFEPLMSYSWPGNARELQNVVHNAVVYAKTLRNLTADDFEAALQRVAKANDFSRSRVNVGDSVTLAEINAAHVSAVLENCGQDQGKAAQILGVDVSYLGGNSSITASAVPGVLPAQVANYIPDKWPGSDASLEVHRAYLTNLLERHKYSKTKAAKESGMVYRTLIKRLHDVGFEKQQRRRRGQLGEQQTEGNLQVSNAPLHGGEADHQSTNTAPAELSDLLKLVARKFSLIEAKIFVAYYGLSGKPPMPLDVLASDFGLRSDRIPQLIAEAWKKLRSNGFDKDEKWLRTILHPSKSVL